MRFSFACTAACFFTSSAITFYTIFSTFSKMLHFTCSVGFVSTITLTKFILSKKDAVRSYLHFFKKMSFKYGNLFLRILIVSRVRPLQDAHNVFAHQGSLLYTKKDCENNMHEILIETVKYFCLSHLVCEEVWKIQQVVYFFSLFLALFLFA